MKIYGISYPQGTNDQIMLKGEVKGVEGTQIHFPVI